ncbi:hypothetical protein PGT21_032699 [Puccinia graminis f. sp. tritici]|uniref:Uncharacterized protein n=1 Tax=Puccinia graminis f. sp. tritici TaxID=56615 RepID=A0A5B0PGV7_PUCGR|nr:hypothetical protein PGT21_000633 [Puccinia graminis f. sp. tritici]KAA1100253.1 hypothetical protein PGT21_032699 [Puccinia graminis f. sp. tritici]
MSLCKQDDTKDQIRLLNTTNTKTPAQVTLAGCERRVTHDNEYPPNDQTTGKSQRNREISVVLAGCNRPQKPKRFDSGSVKERPIMKKRGMEQPSQPARVVQDKTRENEELDDPRSLRGSWGLTSFDDG